MGRIIIYQRCVETPYTSSIDPHVDTVMIWWDNFASPMANWVYFISISGKYQDFGFAPLWAVWAYSIDVGGLNVPSMFLTHKKYHSDQVLLLKFTKSETRTCIYFIYCCPLVADSDDGIQRFET